MVLLRTPSSDKYSLDKESAHGQLCAELCGITLAPLVLWYSNSSGSKRSGSSSKPFCSLGFVFKNHRINVASVEASSIQRCSLAPQSRSSVHKNSYYGPWRHARSPSSSVVNGLAGQVPFTPTLGRCCVPISPGHWALKTLNAEERRPKDDDDDTTK